MSTYYSLIKKIPGDDVFDGRLEEFGIREHIVPGQTTNTYRCLSDGHDYVWVRMDGNGFFWSVRGLSGILYTVADVFETEIVSEHQAQFWGFDTQEEWDAKLDQMAKESEEKFQVSVVNYVRGQPNDIAPGTIGALKADIAKKLVEVDPRFWQRKTKISLFAKWRPYMTETTRSKSR